MEKATRQDAYSARAWLLALLVAVTLILGGGGTPNPTAEILLELVIAAIAAAWVWLPADASTTVRRSADWGVVALLGILIAVPVLQLIPLPPSIWSRLPGRANELAALSLIGEQSSWRPISLSPSRTLASLLAIVPPIFCMYAVARLDLDERRLILAAVVTMAVLSAFLGAFQLTTAGAVGASLYPQHSFGWLTGFQASRNAAADVLLIGLLALAAVSSSYLASISRRLPLGLTRRAFAVLAGAVALLLLLALGMTGSRAGIALLAVVCLGAVLIFAVSSDDARKPMSRLRIVVATLALLATCSTAFVALSQNTSIERALTHLSDLDSERAAIWQDSWFAFGQYWPVGFGIGGFEPAMLPAERLEYLDPLAPNRAHNDFLEIGIEAGILGYAMVLAAVGTCLSLAVRAWRDSPAMRAQIVFALTTLAVIGLHSVVDYPLRSIAVASLAGIAAGLLVRTPVPAPAPSGYRRAELKGLA